MAKGGRVGEEKKKGLEYVIESDLSKK